MRRPAEAFSALACRSSTARRRGGKRRGYAAAAQGGCGRIVCIGGDGTLNAVINGMLGAGVRLPITYIPAGTTNDFARTLRLPRRIGDMRRVLTAGRDVEIDAGRFNDGYFSYVASFGAFTKCSYATRAA
ncbi:diacylglycerol/lipid kinase family protein [Hominenteromicrobium sp.]|uniref:diacylglycerol/lipid kinase family protein n=1 Tax=Hominenteromicrobium sp. TaxID=3073581 RepID=UPI003994437D